MPARSVGNVSRAEIIRVRRRRTPPHPLDRLSKRVSSLTTANELKQHPYRDPERLRAAFEQAGTIAGTAAHFDVSQTTARLWLIQYGLYDPEQQGMSSVANQLEELSPEDLGLPPLGEHQ